MVAWILDNRANHSLGKDAELTPFQTNACRGIQRHLLSIRVAWQNCKARLAGPPAQFLGRRGWKAKRTAAMGASGAHRETARRVGPDGRRAVRDGSAAEGRGVRARCNVRTETSSAPRGVVTRTMHCAVSARHAADWSNQRCVATIMQTMRRMALKGTQGYSAAGRRACNEQSGSCNNRRVHAAWQLHPSAMPLYETRYHNGGPTGAVGY